MSRRVVLPMSTILLTSAGLKIQDEILKLLKKPVAQTRLVQITTASNVEEDKTYINRDRELFKTLGFKITEVDFEGMNEANVRASLEDVDVVYVQGGNTFHLLRCVRASGFDRVIKELIESGVFYIGVSAGSIIMGPTIASAGWKMCSSQPDKNTFGMTDLTALNLVPFNLIVHYNLKDAMLVSRAIHGSHYPVRILTDDQAFLVEDGKTTLVGKGAEVVLSENETIVASEPKL